MPDLIERRCSFIAGQWVTGDDSFPVENPADESVVAEVSAASAADVAQAIEAARQSFDSGIWADRAPADRVAGVRQMLTHISTASESLVATLVAETGQPVWFAEQTQLRLGLRLAHQLIDIYLTAADEELNSVPTDNLTRRGLVMSLRRHEPVGVVAAITPYNAAFMTAIQKIVPALLTGNSVILRPSPLTPISSLLLGDAAVAAGLPDGVLSVVIEHGATGAQELSSAPDVDMVSFTGSTAVGRSILSQAAPTVKRVALELGGKSAQIYLPDAIHRAAANAVAVVAGTAGQACIAATRMLVPQESKAEVLEAVSTAFQNLVVGPPSNPRALVGPVITSAQRERCEHYVALSERDGGKVVCGGGRPAQLDRGYFFEPTVLDVPDNDNPAAQDEIFGPVLTVLGYQGVDDAVRMANDSPYGLAGQVFGADVAAAASVARRLRTGAVSVNKTFFSAYAPSGGYKQSGLGRERGIEGIRAFQEVKHMSIGELDQ